MGERIFELQPEIPSLRATAKPQTKRRQVLRGALFIAVILIVISLLWTGAQCTFNSRREPNPKMVAATTALTPHRVQTVVPVVYTRTATPLPKVEVWLAEGCNGTYAVGDTVMVKFRSDVNGLINIVSYPGDSARENFLTQVVTAGKTYSVSATFIEPAYGMEKLIANLDAQPADNAPCIYTVTRRSAIARIEPPPTIPPTASPSSTPAPQVEIWLSKGCDRVYQVGDVIYLYYRADVNGVVEIWDYPPGESGILFLEQEVEAGIKYGREIKIVPPVGAEERVVARLKGAKESAECRFAVEER